MITILYPVKTEVRKHVANIYLHIDFHTVIKHFYFIYGISPFLIVSGQINWPKRIIYEILNYFYGYFFLKLQYFGKIQKVCRAAFCVPCQQAVGVSATSGAHDPQIEVSTFASSRCLLEPSRDNTTIPCVTTSGIKWKPNSWGYGVKISSLYPIKYLPDNLPRSALRLIQTEW